MSAFGYLDDHGRIRCLTVSRGDAERNARLNGLTTIVEVATTPAGNVPAMGATIIATHDVPPPAPIVWADGYGRWAAAVPPGGTRENARTAILAELEARDDHYAPERSTVARRQSTGVQYFDGRNWRAVPDGWTVYVEAWRWAR